jgi:4-amino-4-deoxy-L-arabinose transferase-like glycosyltransferase
MSGPARGLLRRAAHWQLATGLVLLAALLRLGNMAYQADSPIFLTAVSDEFEHYSLASTLASGDWLGRTVGPFHRPQLFAYACAMLFKLFGTSYMVTHALVVVSDLIAIPAWFALARRAFPRVPAVIGTLFIVMHWPFVHFSGTGYMESFAMALNAVFLLLLSIHAQGVMRHPRRPLFPRHGLPLLGAGILGGLSILTRPTVLLLMPVIGFMLLWLHARAGRRLDARAFVPPVAFVLAVALTISPNAIRHYAMFGLWAPLGTGSELNFHMSNNRDGWGWEYSSPGIEFQIYQNLPIVEGGVARSVPDVRAFWAARNAAYLREEPGRCARGIALKLLQVLGAREVHCTNDFVYTRSRSPILRFLPGLGVFGPFGLVGLGILVGSLFAGGRALAGGLSASRHWTRTLLAAWVIVYLAGAALFLAISRHRLPALPPLLLMGGWALCLVARRVAADPGRLLRWGALLLLCVAVTRLPVIPGWYGDHERWWTQVNLGVALMKLDRPAEAVEELEKGIAIMPDKLEGWRQLALAQRATGAFAEAAGSQAELLRLLRLQYPAYDMIEAEVLDQLVVLQGGAGEFDQAEVSARQLVALVPDSPRSNCLLARVLISNGKPAEARRALQAALRADAAYPAALELMAELNAVPGQ